MKKTEPNVGATVRGYLEAAIASFAKDNPDTEFQRGYLAALLEVYDTFFDDGSTSYNRHHLAGEKVLASTRQMDIVFRGWKPR